MTHKFYEELPDMHLLAGSTSDTITLEFEEGVLANDATMSVYLARAETPDTIVNDITCTKSGDTFTVAIPAGKSKNMHGVYNMDFVLTNGGTVKKVARGQLVVEFSPELAS